MASKTVFQLSYKELYSWVEEVKTDRTSARCTLCKKTFYIGSMGRTALSSHANSKKHKAVVSAQSKSVGMGVYLKGSGKESTTITHPDCHLESGMVMGKTVVTSSSSESKSVLPSKSNSGKINQFLLHSDVTKAEVLWCLHTVMNHTSFRGSASCIPVFKLMFPDSEIAKKLQLQRTKLAYTIVYGLAPHFSEELQQLLNACDHIVVGFDESLNSVAQKQQMDIAVRFWDVTKSQVSTRYLTSVFLGNCTALDLLCAFKEALTSNLLPKVTQVSLDGPNVNLKFLKDLSEELRENRDGQVLLNMGTCGLHTIHGAFKTAINKTGWKIIEFLRALYYLFKDVPTRRAEYTRLTGSVMFPLKFCPIRWVENGKVVERASSMVPYLMKYVEYSQKEKKEPNCSSYNTMVEALKDKFLLPKLAFFESLSHMVEPFLRDFQNDAPMAPFLFFDLRALAVSFIERIIYDDIKKVSTSALLNLTKTGKLIPASKLDVGFATSAALKKVKGVKELQVLEFREQCRKAYSAFVDKMFDKSPIKYKLTEAITCLDPFLIANDQENSEKQLKNCLDILVENDWFSGIKADKIKSEYKIFCSLPDILEKMKGYKRNDTRLDVFWTTLLESATRSFPELLSLIKFILIFSHGNAALERGFSINKECVIENQEEQSLIALRQVYDSVTALGGIEAVNITTDLIHAARNAHSRYTECLQKKKMENESRMELEKKRKRVIEETKILEDKKRKLLEDAKKEAALIEEQIILLKKH